MKQTAVEWLIDKLKSQGLLIGEPNNLVAVREAKEIEKEQIIDAYDVPWVPNIKNGNDYYNETFKK
jgi:hypothetical protein